LKSISDKSSQSNLTDYEAKVLAGFKMKKLKLHFNAGYRTVDDGIDELNSLDDEVFAGLAVDFSINRRLRAFLETEWRTNRLKEEDDIIRVTPGVQVYLTPNATLSGGVDFFLSDTQHEWRAIVGISTCGGLGEYVVPIPKPKELDVVQKPKGRPPVPILPEMIASKRERMKTEFIGEAVAMPGEELMAGDLSIAPVSRFEVALTPGEEEVIAVPLPSIGAPSVPGEVLLPVMSGLEGMKSARIARKFRIPELMFDYNSWALKPPSLMGVKVISEEMLKYKKGFFVKVEGHTDSVGAASYNEKLSLQRATAVAEAMVDKYNIPPENIFIEGYGESRPIDSNETAQGRSNNRRVDIILLLPE
jgi:outer membrane protein OmpA-like peptidoglycan-associated protein